MVRLRTADLIARSAELDELRAAVEAAQSGQRAAVVVCAAPASTAVPVKEEKEAVRPAGGLSPIVTAALRAEEPLTAEGIAERSKPWARPKLGGAAHRPATLPPLPTIPN